MCLHQKPSALALHSTLLVFFLPRLTLNSKHALERCRPTDPFRCIDTAKHYSHVRLLSISLV